MGRPLRCQLHLGDIVDSRIVQSYKHGLEEILEKGLDETGPWHDERVTDDSENCKVVIADVPRQVDARRSVHEKEAFSLDSLR